MMPVNFGKGPKTATQIEGEDQHNNERIELVGRTLAETGVKRLFMLILKNASEYADQQASFQLNGRWLTVNPREWKNGFDLQINVGLGTGAKEQQARSIMGIMDVQREHALHGLPTVGPQQIYNSAKRLTQVGGYKSADEFFIDPKTIPPKPPEPPKPDPKLMLEANQKEIKKSVEKLYNLASELKAEVEKTDSVHVLSVAMLRKTDEIERLAKEIRSRAKA